jgi:hypothetical protein
MENNTIVDKMVLVLQASNLMLGGERYIKSAIESCSTIQDVLPNK